MSNDLKIKELERLAIIKKLAPKYRKVKTLVKPKIEDVPVYFVDNEIDRLYFDGKRLSLPQDYREELPINFLD
jgi:hypothetical protein